jgi:hypothetical protein
VKQMRKYKTQKKKRGEKGKEEGIKEREDP